MRRAILTLLLIPHLAFAQEGFQIQYPDIGVPLEATLPSYLQYWLNFSIYLGAFIAFFVLVKGGFKYFLATGSPQMKKEVWQNVTAAGTGLLILMTSWLIMNAINPMLVTLPSDRFDPPSFLFESINTDEATYVAIPVGEMIEATTFSPEFMDYAGTMAAQLAELQNINADLVSLSADLYKEMEKCSCGESECEQDDDCLCEKGSCPDAYCDQEKINMLIAELKEKIGEQEEYTQYFDSEKIKEESKFENPIYGLKQLSAVHMLISLTSPEKILTYQGMLQAREGKGEDKIHFTTEPFPEWKNLYERKPFDPFLFYVHASSSENVLTTVRETINSMDIGEIERPDNSSDDSGTTGPSYDYDAPDLPDELSKLPKDYPSFVQYRETWQCCSRSPGAQTGTTVAATGCADTSLSMIIAYWYKYSPSVREAWNNILKEYTIPEYGEFPPVNKCSSDKRTCKRFSSVSLDPDPYTVVQLLNQYGVNTSNWTWNTVKLDNLLKALNIKVMNIRTMSIANIEHFLRQGYSVSLFCDYYRWNNRSCCDNGAAGDCPGNQACNHWVTPYKVEDGNLYIKDPAAHWTDKAISPAQFKALGCGTARPYGESSLIFYPIVWP